MNNVIRHSYFGQEYISELSGCSFYFPTEDSQNKIMGVFKGKVFCIFSLKEIEGGVEVYISFPDNYKCHHYMKGKLVHEFKSDNAHLTYHGSPKRKKMSGEIHIKNNGENPLKGRANLLEAPRVSTSNIELHPLPICRIELTGEPGIVDSKKEVNNFFNIDLPNLFFNTIEVNLSKRGYLESIAGVTNIENSPYKSLFVYTSLHTYFTGNIELKPGYYPQALALQTAKYELILIVGRELKNPNYKQNTLISFHTKDYFKELGQRKLVENEKGYFIAKGVTLESTSCLRMRDVLHSFPKSCLDTRKS